jgi:hypothetical protein
LRLKVSAGVHPQAESAATSATASRPPSRPPFFIHRVRMLILQLMASPPHRDDGGRAKQSRTILCRADIAAKLQR